MKIIQILLVFYLFIVPTTAQKKGIIIDADTGNEMDDFYAIVSALLDDQLDVTALISAHFNNPQLLTDSLWHIYPTDNINTLQISQDENEELLSRMDMENIPHPMGCDRMIGYAWGYYPGAPIPSSPGVDHIIAEAKKASPGKKLDHVGFSANRSHCKPGMGNNQRIQYTTRKHATKNKSLYLY